MNFRKYTLTFLALCCVGGAFSQSLGQAKRWFNEGNFEQAKPVFKRFVKQQPSNTNYNFWYGACCYETGELMESLPYLEKAAQRKVINGYLYLSKAYYDLYRFDEAIENLEEHIYWLDRKKRDTSAAELWMNKLRKGANMIRGVEDITVIDSFVVDKQNFLQAYKLSPESGRLIMAQDSACTAYTNEMGDKSFFSQRNSEGESSIYSSIKLIDKWNKPVLQRGLNNELSQLNYPFMDSDGMTLYFAAKGEECIGGYDIFVTRSDSEDNTFLKPDNIGFPFNSPANDYMFAIDDYSNLGWFASDRYQPEDSVCVYVFIPNEQKIVHDYDNTDPQKLRTLASLRCIQATQNDTNNVIDGRRRLQAISTEKVEKTTKSEFVFIINDDLIYTSLKDFKSKEAKKQYQVMVQANNDKKLIINELSSMRDKYSKATVDQKRQMAPGMLDKENRIQELQNQLNSLENEIRNLEIIALKN